MVHQPINLKIRSGGLKHPHESFIPEGILGGHKATISVLHHQKGNLARRLLPEYFENVKCTLQIKTPLSLLFLVFTRNRSGF